MYQTKVISDSYDVEKRLEKFNVTKAELIEVVHKVVMARNQAVSIDPLPSEGLLAYIYGTRALREILLKKGWKIDRSENIEATFNKQLGIKVIYQSAESASELNIDPRAVSNKGAGSKRVVASGQADLMYAFGDVQSHAKHAENQEVWFFYVSVNGTDICAELSRPGAIENGQFANFIERIFIIKSGEFDPTNNTSKLPDNQHTIDANDEEFDIQVSRK